MYKKTQCLIAMMMYGLQSPLDNPESTLIDVEYMQKSILPDMVHKARNKGLNADEFRSLRAEIPKISTFAMKVFDNPESAQRFQTLYESQDTIQHCKRYAELARSVRHPVNLCVLLEECVLTGATIAGSTFVHNKYDLVENQVITGACLVMTTLILDGIITKYRRSAYEEKAKEASQQILAIDHFIDTYADNKQYTHECVRNDEYAVFRLIANNDNALIRDVFYLTRSLVLMLNYNVNNVLLLSSLKRIVPELTRNASVNRAIVKKDIGNARAYTLAAILANITVMMVAGSIVYKANPTDDDYMVAAYLATNSIMQIPDLGLTRIPMNLLGACSLFMNAVLIKHNAEDRKNSSRSRTKSNMGARQGSVEMTSVQIDQ
jgi:hypothetical protein